MSILHGYAVERDGRVTTDLELSVQSILERRSRVVYVLQAHLAAVRKHRRDLSDLEWKLAHLERQA